MDFSVYGINSVLLYPFYLDFKNKHSLLDKNYISVRDVY